MTRDGAAKALLAAASAIGLSLASPAGAAPACPATAVRVARPTVEVDVEVDPGDAALAARIEQHLAAALNARDIDLCVADSEEVSTGVARVRIRVDSPAQGPTVVLLQIGDAITQKRVERTMDLGSIPPDGRALSIASSADELLRASWAELELVDATRPSEAPPAAVIHAVESTERVPTRTSLFEIGGETSVSVLPLRTAYGGALRVGYWATPHLGTLVAVGPSFGLRRSAPDGSVREDAFGVEAGLAYSPWSTHLPVGLDVEASAMLLGLWFSAQAGGHALATSFGDWSMMGGARVRAWLGVATVRITLSLGSAWAFRASRAFDSGRTVTSNEGAGGELRAGVWATY